MAWIESHTVLIRHRKTINFGIYLAIKPVQVLGHLHCLWHNVLEQAEDGNISHWSDEFTASMASWEGDPKFFCKGLKGVGWQDEDGKIHDWLDYAGAFLIRKYSTSNRKKLKEIWKKYGRVYGQRYLKSHKLQKLDKASSKRAVSEQKATLPNLTKPNLTKPIDGASAKRCLSHFGEVFLKTYNQKYHAEFAKDTELFKKLLKTHTEDKILSLINKFFSTEDKWVKEAGHTVGVFKTQVNKLVTEAEKPGRLI